MSGGVDSSTAAVLLKNEGYDVVGCTMQLWDYRRNSTEDGKPQPGRCCSLDDVYDARRVAEQMGFPFYVLNLQKQFEQRVIAPFINDYLAGRTPIPCTLCNTFLKFDELLVFARKIGIDRVATGHYARVSYSPEEGHMLLKGKCSSKDQSYYLFELTQEQLSHVQFPVGEYEKSSIREIASSHSLSTRSIPCTLCNTFLKFDELLVFARKIGIDRVATGHYARVSYSPEEGHMLLKGKCSSKDQSYYLFELTQEQLSHVQFPVGEYEKSSIREIASSHSLSTAGKPDSQEICFIPDGDYAGFIRNHTEEVKKDLVPLLERIRTSASTGPSGQSPFQDSPDGRDTRTGCGLL